MLQASQCNEALENWERAELWIRRCSERYQSQSRDWYFWCARTGKGDLTAARDYALGKRPDGNHLKPDSNAWMDVLLASDDLKRTRELFEIITRTKQSNYSPILLLVLTYDELGEKNLRNEYLKKVPSNDPTAYAMLGNIFRQTLTKGEDAMIEFADIQKALNLARAIPGAEANVRYFLGRFLIHRGHVKKGSEYLRELVESPLTGSRTRAWAAVALRRANKR